MFKTENAPVMPEGYFTPTPEMFGRPVDISLWKGLVAEAGTGPVESGLDGMNCLRTLPSPYQICPINPVWTPGQS